MRASTWRSSIWLIAAALAASRAMPMLPNTKRSSGGNPVTERNMPTMAVNMISMTTRGLHSS